MKTVLWFHNVAIKVCLRLSLGVQIEKLVLSQNVGIRKQTIYWFQTWFCARLGQTRFMMWGNRMSWDTWFLKSLRKREMAKLLIFQKGPQTQSVILLLIFSSSKLYPTLVRYWIYFMYSYLFLKKAFSVNSIRMLKLSVYLDIRKLAKKVQQCC